MRASYFLHVFQPRLDAKEVVMDEKLRQDIALFRHSVIGQLLSAELGYGELRESIRALA